MGQGAVDEGPIPGRARNRHHRCGMKARRLLFILTFVGLGSAAAALAQTEDLPPPPPGYEPKVPEKVESVLDKTAVKSKLVNIHWGLAPIIDYTWFGQDPASVDQVGFQDDAFQVRSGRAMARGTLFNDWSRPWKFLVSFEYRGFDSNPDDTWSWTDVWVQVQIGRLAHVALGKGRGG